MYLGQGKAYDCVQGGGGGRGGHTTVRTQKKNSIAFSACILQYFLLQKDSILPSTKVVEEIFHRLFHKILQHFLDYLVATGHNCSKRGSDNPNRPVKQNYAGGHHTQERKLRQLESVFVIHK